MMANKSGELLQIGGAMKKGQGKYTWVYIRFVRQPELNPEGLASDRCPECGSQAVVHVENGKRKRHVCAECLATWVKCNFKP
jgi:ribosomal protein L37AE/L43A